MSSGKRLKLPAACALDLDPHVSKRVHHLSWTIEVNVGRLAEERQLRNAGRKLTPQLVGQDLVRTFETNDKPAPALDINCHSGELHCCDRNDAIELELCYLLE